MSYYQIIINDFARLSDGVLGNSRQLNLPSLKLLAKYTGKLNVIYYV